MVSPKTDGSKLHRFLAPMENTKLFRGLFAVASKGRSSPAAKHKHQSGHQKRAKGKAKIKAKARPGLLLHPADMHRTCVPSVASMSE